MQGVITLSAIAVFFLLVSSIDGQSLKVSSSILHSGHSLQNNFLSLLLVLFHSFLAFFWLSFAASRCKASRTLNLASVSSAPSLPPRANHDKAREDDHGGDADGEGHCVA
jgi:hypothetical protein